MPSMMEILQVDISLRNEEQTEKGKCIARARDILLKRSDKEAKYLLKVLECTADNLNLVVWWKYGLQVSQSIS